MRGFSERIFVSTQAQQGQGWGGSLEERACAAALGKVWAVGLLGSQEDTLLAGLWGVKEHLGQSTGP